MEYCPVSATDGMDAPANWHDEGMYKRCSYCGSIHPDVFMELCRQGVEITPTDKNYKVYLAYDVTSKFYFEHLSIEQMGEFVGMVNRGEVKLSYPGHFYVNPFFIK